MKKQLIQLLILLTILFIHLSCDIFLSNTDDEDTLKRSDDGSYKHIIMVYMDGDNNLESAAIEDLNEMEAADSNFSDVKIIVLIDRVTGYDESNDDWTGTRLYEITEDSNISNINSTRLAGMGLEGLDTDELNMGDPSTLTDFVSFVKETYDSELYSLIMWNHGGGWRDMDSSLSSTSDETTRAICWDDTSGDDALYMEEVSSALDGENLAVIGFDACLMGMLEVGYQLKDSGNIMVASEENEPGDGWDYDGLLSSFIITDNTGASLATSIVDAYESEYDQYSYTLSAVDLTVVDDVIDKLNIFSKSLIDGSATNSDILSARDGVNQYNDSDYYNYYAYIDLYEYVVACETLDGVLGVSELLESIDTYVIDNFSDGNNTGSKGVSIYFPITTNHYEYDDYTSDNITFPSVSYWDNLLESVLTLDPDSFEDDDYSNNGTPLVVGTSQTHNFDEGDDIDWFEIEGLAGYTYTIITTSSGEDLEPYTVLYLFNSSSNSSYDNTYNDGETTTSELSYSCLSDENLYVYCKSYDYETIGSYIISVTKEVTP